MNLHTGQNKKKSTQQPGTTKKVTISDEGIIQGGSLVASLLLVATMHGRHVSADTLLAGLPIENGILRPSLFSRAAARAGLKSKIINQQIEQINAMLCPVILILNNNKACVAVSIDTEKEICKVIFPEEFAGGSADLSFEEMKDAYTGYVIYIKPDFDGKIAREFHKKGDGLWFWSTIGAEKKVYRDVLLASLLSNLFAFAMPIFVMNVYNRIIPNNAIESMWALAIGVFIMMTADLVLNISRGYLTDLAASKTNTRLSADMMEHILAIKGEERPSSVGSMINSIQGFDSVRSFISSATIFAYVDLPFSILFLIVIALISKALAIPVIIGSLFVLIEAIVVQKKMRELSETTGTASAIKNATMVEGLVAIESVKTQNMEGSIQDKWEQTVAHMEKQNVKMRMLSSLVVTQTQWINVTVSLAVLIIGVYLIRDGSINMGALIAANMLSSRAMMPIGKVAGLLMQYYTTSRSLKALDDIMEKETERDEETTFVSRPKINGDIDIENLTFTYPGQDKPALENINLHIRAGEKVAFIGPIGSGKTTLFRLLLKLYTPQEGAIYVDGTDIRQLDPAELRRNMGVVPQDVMLMNDTLRRNLTLGNAYISDKELLFAVQVSGVDGIVRNHPKGFDMIAGERGMNLSCGQRQAVAVARAILTNPPVIMLDEPTSSMDMRSEERIRHNLKIVTKHKTVLLITHRTALLSLVDRVVVFDNGKIVADGSKDSILKAFQEGGIAREKNV